MQGTVRDIELLPEDTFTNLSDEFELHGQKSQGVT